MFSNIQFFDQVSDPVIQVAFVEGPGKKGNVTNIPFWEDTIKTNNTIPISDLSQRLNQLQNDVISTYTAQGYSLNQILNEELRHSDPNYNRENGLFGAYDSPDALYSYFSDGSIDSASLGSVISLKGTDDLLIIIGADASTIGDGNAATYWSYQSKPYQGLTETFAFTGIFTQGSAEQYLPRDIAQNLFAVAIKPSNNFGGGQPYTVNIPYDSVDSLKKSFGIVGRVYLDKVTGSAPNPANLLPSRILWLTKNPNHVAQTQQINTVTPATIADLALEYKDTGKLLREKESPNHVSSGVVLNYGSIAIRNNIKPLTDKAKGYDELTNSKAQTSPFKVIDDLLGTTDDTPLFSLESPPSIIDPLSLPL
jgi:hypothetical protein